MQSEYIWKVIREKGGRVTPIKKAVVDILLATHDPISQNELTKKLRERLFYPDRTTLYRLFLWLEEIGVVESFRVASVEGRWYEIVSEHHHHLVCTHCKHVQDVFLEEHLHEQEGEISQATGFRVDKHALEFYGTCKSCL